MGELTSHDVRLSRSNRGGHLPAGLAATLSELARQLQREPDDKQLLKLVSVAAAREIPGADWAGVTVFTGGQIHTAAASDPIVLEIDRLQYEIGAGPCVEASTEGFTVRSDDLETDGRWAGFPQAAAERGVRAMMSMQLFVQERDLGALNVYAAKPDAFSDDSETIGLLLSAHASVALANALQVKNLRVAVDSRDIIGQAKGILMERYKLTSQQAFDLLVGASQTTHRKLREVAIDVTETGELTSGR